MAASSNYSITVQAEIDWSKLEEKKKRDTPIEVDIKLNEADIAKQVQTAVSKAKPKLSDIEVDTSKLVSKINSQLAKTKFEVVIKDNTGSKTKGVLTSYEKQAANAEKALQTLTDKQKYWTESFEDGKYSSFFKGYSDEINKAYSELAKFQNLLNSGAASDDDLDDQMQNVRVAIEGCRNALTQCKQEMNAFNKLDEAFNLGKTEAKIESLFSKFEKAGGQLNTALSEAVANALDTDATEPLEKIRTLMEKINEEKNQSNGGNVERLTDLYEELSVAAEKAENAIKSVSTAQGGWVSYDDNKISSLLSQLSKIDGDESTSLMSRLNKAVGSGGLTGNEFKDIKSQADALTASTNELGNAGEQAGGKWKNFLSQFTAMFSAMQVVQAIKQIGTAMFENVKNVDSAMVELRKVTNETSSTYDDFLTSAGNTAKSLGTTISDYISSTADFARLGYNFEQAQTLATVASKYNVVGDDLKDISEATEHIISIMNGFNIEADNAISIVDKLNEVSNTESISSGGLGAALTRSASSLAAANNDINQSIGMITAANTVVQNPEQVGNALKVISMRIRGASTEIEAMGEDTDGMAVSTAKLREEIKALTGVDIMQDSSTFKSTFDIFSEISDVWDDLTDIQQADRNLNIQQCIYRTRLIAGNS